MLAEFPDRATVMASAFPDNPDVEMALAEGDDEGSPIAGTVMRLLDNKLAMQNINYMAVTGLSAPDYSGYNEIWQTFNMREAEMNAAFRGDVALGPLGGGDATEGQPFRSAVRAAGGTVDTPGQGGAMRRAWAGFEGPKAFEQKQQFLRKATARAMVEAQELERRGEMGLKTSGVAQELIQERTLRVRAEAERDRALAELGQGPPPPLIEPGSKVAELEGGQRVPQSVAPKTREGIESRAAGRPTPTADEPEDRTARYGTRTPTQKWSGGGTR